MNGPARRRKGSRQSPGRSRELKRRIGFAARKIAGEMLADVIVRKLPLDQMLESGRGHPGFVALIAKDRALVRAILGVALRRHGEIEAALGTLLETPLPRKSGDLRHVLAIAAAQILFLDIPDRAAVSIAVDIAAGDRHMRHFKRLANAVLRRLSEGKATILDGIDAPRVNTPDWLWARWQEHYGDAATRRIAAAHMIEPALDLTVKSDASGWAERLGGIVLPTGSVRRRAKGAIERLDGYGEGEWWVQDVAASLPARLIGDVAGKRVADLCAAPGGKTAQLAAMGADVVAVDKSPARLKRLDENLERLRLKAETIAVDALDFKPSSPFDAVLLDAPCSATGTIRRHPDIALIKAEADIAALADLQKRLLRKAVKLVGSGGVVVFCTCSLEREEGEDVVAAVLAEDDGLERLPIGAEEISGLEAALTAAGDLRTLPFHLDTGDPARSGNDGFYIARLRRR